MNIIVKVSTEIEAEPAAIWKIVSNFSEWHLWHRSNVIVSTEKGIPCNLGFKMYGIPINLKLTDVEVVELKSISWTGFIPLTGYLLSGKRRIEINRTISGSTTLVQTEAFHGVLSAFFRNGLIKTYSRNYEVLNMNIKRLAERRSINSLQ